MNKLVLASLVVLATGNASAQLSAPSADHNGRELKQAQVSKDDPDYALYRYAVLKNTSVVLPATVKPAAESGRWVPGPYALYLEHVNGMSRTEALAKAQRIGETPVFVANETRHAPRHLSSYQLYERSVLKTPEFEIERDRDRVPHQDANAALAPNSAR